MTTRIKKGQVTKPQIATLLRQLTEWEANNRSQIEALKPEFKQWVHSQLIEIMRLVESQDYFSSIQSRVAHMVTTTNRMRAGEIESVSLDGMGFTLTRKAD